MSRSGSRLELVCSPAARLRAARASTSSTVAFAERRVTKLRHGTSGASRAGRRGPSESKQFKRFLGELEHVNGLTQEEARGAAGGQVQATPASLLPRPAPVDSPPSPHSAEGHGEAFPEALPVDAVTLLADLDVGLAEPAVWGEVSQDAPAAIQEHQPARVAAPAQTPAADMDTSLTWGDVPALPPPVYRGPGAPTYARGSDVHAPPSPAGSLSSSSSESSVGSSDAPIPPCAEHCGGGTEHK